MAVEEGRVVTAPRRMLLGLVEARRRRRRQGATSEGRAAKRRRLAAEGPAPAAAPAAAPASEAARLLRQARGLRDAAASEESIAEAELALRRAESAARSRLRDLARAGAHPEGAEAAAAAEELQRAGDLVSLLLLQEGRGSEEERRKRLLRSGYLYRLSDGILRYPLPEPPLPRLGAAPAGGGAAYAHAADGVLPAALLRQLAAAFAPGSPFWAEHGYSVDPPSPYFSYRHTLADPPQSSMDDVIRLVHRAVCEQLPPAREALYAEWWAHQRAHPRGHQMHFDADNEGRGGVRNPIVNTILYLSDGVGGPTVVTDQRHGEAALGTTGWLVYPRTNRIAMYPADVLHGVVPGRGPSPQGGRRTTLMIAFWGKKGCPLRPSAAPCASRPFPSPATAYRSPPDRRQYSWPRLLERLASRPWELSGHSARPVHPAVVSPVWVDVCPRRNAARGAGAAELSELPHYDTCFQW